ncbi:MAG TPA: undecaprenyldiphospho-muramoylpentapeptide beta-N-acetylglucosaminyltransferase [Elusimicrobiota bacterium]|nr:undecaprenyldiphospho-muramoylpentapeptide beta-N-acetylglucosaminyltransferase [Elusimicrobiota bacterium]
MRVCIAAGGTGGHLLPGVAVGKELRARGHEVHFVVRKDRSSQERLAREGFPSSAFAYAGFPRALSLRALIYPGLSLAAYLNARRILRREDPDVVLGMGGYISVPVGLAARRADIPLVLHEQNSYAGLANRWLARWASAVATTFPETAGLPPQARRRWTGLPLRPEIMPRDRRACRAGLGLSPDLFTVLIFGGSQGARALNRLAASSLAPLSEFRDRCQFIHVAGEADADVMEQVYADAGWNHFVRPYWEDIATLYAAADFVVSRSGANTVMELAYLGKKALLVPFPFATNDHQRLNAAFLAKSGRAEVVLEKDLSPGRFREILKQAFVSPLEAEAAPPKDFPRATASLADLLEDVRFGKT